MSWIFGNDEDNKPRRPAIIPHSNSNSSAKNDKSSSGGWCGVIVLAALSVTALITGLIAGVVTHLV